MHTRIALAVVTTLLATNVVAAHELELSKEFSVCLSAEKSIKAARHVVIDVEKAYVSTQRGEVAEFVFDELGIGAYNQLIDNGQVKGVPFSAGSGVTVFAQLFQGDSIVFVAKVLEPRPTWIYATFSKVESPEAAAQAVQIMRSLKSCKSG